MHEEDDTEASGFFEPACVIHAIHIIPAFTHGCTTKLLSPSVGRGAKASQEDWEFFYVNQ